MMKHNSCFITVLLFLYYQCIESNISVSVTTEHFPVKIRQKFPINFHHPAMKKHDESALLRLEVVCYKNATETIELYPGFDDYEYIQDGKLFRLEELIVNQFNTQIIVRFYRYAHHCNFKISYCKKGNQNKQYESIYNKKIVLYKKPKMNLIFKSQDGHLGGLRMNKIGFIECTATDGFPQSKPYLYYEKFINPSAVTHSNSKIIVQFMVKRNYHNSEVTCISGKSTAKIKIKVFQHAQSITVYPVTEYAMPNSTFSCRMFGESYPRARLSWKTSDLSTNIRYFRIWGDDIFTYITLLHNIPMKSKWNLTCSATNTIPVNIVGGPEKTLYLTIGKDPYGLEKMFYKCLKYFLIILVVSGVLIAFIVGMRKCYKHINKEKSHSHTAIPLEEKPSAPDDAEDNVPSNYTEHKRPLTSIISKQNSPTNIKPKKRTVSLSEFPERRRPKYIFRKPNIRGDNVDVIV